jgi:hypothetical protein
VMMTLATAVMMMMTLATAVMRTPTKRWG